MLIPSCKKSASPSKRALELAGRPASALPPGSLASVQDEPALPTRNQSVLGRFEPRLGHHPGDPATPRTAPRRRPAEPSGLQRPGGPGRRHPRLGRCRRPARCCVRSGSRRPTLDHVLDRRISVTGQQDERRRVRADTLIVAAVTLTRASQGACCPHSQKSSITSGDPVSAAAPSSKLAVHLGHALVHLAVEVLRLGVPFDRVCHCHLDLSTPASGHRRRDPSACHEARPVSEGGRFTQRQLSKTRGMTDVSTIFRKNKRILLGDERLEPLGLLLQRALGVPAKRANGSSTTRPLSSCHVPATKPSTRIVACTIPLFVTIARRRNVAEDPRPVGVREHEVVEARHQPHAAQACRGPAAAPAGGRRASAPARRGTSAATAAPARR